MKALMEITLEEVQIILDWYRDSDAWWADRGADMAEEEYALYEKLVNIEKSLKEGVQE